jgi:hypothetical protein
MKKIIFIVILFISCKHKPTHAIIWKSHLTFGGNKMPNGLCRYLYDDGFKGVEFNDSCNKYNIGDTINFKTPKP